MGSEDFISIANNCDFLLIVKLPNFSEDNSNQQQRFITLIDILYEKKIPYVKKPPFFDNLSDEPEGFREIKKIETLCRIDTKNELEYYKNGGILQYVLRNMI